MNTTMLIELIYKVDDINSYRVSSSYINMETITLTFGDRAENHNGMQIIGSVADCGFSKKTMEKIQNVFHNYDTEWFNLHEYIDADVECSYILIIRKGVEYFVDPNDVQKEQDTLTKDTKAKMYGRVVNKRARYNLCFDHNGQEPDYENGMGRIVPFSEVPLLDKLKNGLERISGADLKVEANYYYDVRKCGIGWHGDTERRIVIGVRLGHSLPLHFRWYKNGKPIENSRCKLMLHHGDIYVMSEKAVGTDWKKRNRYTLRHSAGADKFLYAK